MTRAKAQKRLMGRDGISRRMAMGVAAGRVVTNPRGEVVGVLPVPIWACDPVPCKNRGSFGGSEAPITAQSVAWVDPIPDDLHWIDRALAQLERVNRMRAQILREEFMGTGTQTMKARRVAEEYGGELTVWQYRKELGKALAFLEVTEK